MIEILILYVLTKYDCSIYRIKKIIEQSFFAYVKPSFGSLNPAIARLESLGCVTSSMSLTNGGRRTKRISITQFGEKYLKTMMIEYEFSNPSSFLNDISILIFCSNILKGDDLIKFKDNIKLQIKIFERNLLFFLDSPYSNLSDNQKKLCKKTLSYAKEVGELC